MPFSNRLRSGRRAIRGALPALFLFLLLLVALTLWVEAAPPRQSATAGQTLFQQKCASCHSPGTETLVGPGLRYETLARSRRIGCRPGLPPPTSSLPRGILWPLAW